MERISQQQPKITPIPPLHTKCETLLASLICLRAETPTPPRPTSQTCPPQSSCEVLELEKRAMEGSTNAERVSLPYSASAVLSSFSVFFLLTPSVPTIIQTPKLRVSELRTWPGQISDKQRFSSLAAHCRVLPTKCFCRHARLRFFFPSWVQRSDRRTSRSNRVTHPRLPPPPSCTPHPT